jgi:hypothetical protein
MAFPVEGDEHDRAERLWSVYALERSADQTTPAVSFAIATVGITYAATTVAVLLGTAPGTVSAAVRLTMPLVIVGLFTALVVQDATSQVRGFYLNDLEVELARLSGRDYGAPDRSNDVVIPAYRQLSRPVLLAGTARKPSKLKICLFALAHPYSLSGAFVTAYTLFVVCFNGPVEWPEIVAAIAYCLAMVGNFVRLGFARSEKRYRVLQSRLMQVARGSGQDTIERR